jgi:hypothetical protein
MELNDSNFFSFAMAHYHNPNCTGSNEFDEDLRCIIHLKKLLRRYKKNGEIKTRLMLNHLTLFYNVFLPPLATTRMLALKLDEYMEQVKPLLLSLGYWPDTIPRIAGRTIIGSDVALDPAIVAALRAEFSGV